MNGLYLKSAFLVQSSDHSRYFCTPYHIHPFIHANACSSHARTDGVKFRSNLKFSVSLNDTRRRVIEPQIIWLVSNPLYLLSHSLRDCSAVRHVKQLRCTDLPLNWNAIQYKSKSQYITKCTQWNNNSTHTRIYNVGHKVEALWEKQPKSKHTDKASWTELTSPSVYCRNILSADDLRAVYTHCGVYQLVKPDISPGSVPCYCWCITEPGSFLICCSPAGSNTTNLSWCSDREVSGANCYGEWAQDKSMHNGTEVA